MVEVADDICFRTRTSNDKDPASHLQTTATNYGALFSGRKQTLTAITYRY
ncbi:hypothetical protein OH492_17190 [Vibrio chagasii]|nr:hypothetical protein [Vibrio chagasii]